MRGRGPARTRTGGPTADGGTRSRTRAVSDVLGFVLVFSLVVVVTATTVAVGFSGLQGARDVEQVSNAERAFDVLAENVDDVAVRDAPGRATEIRLSNARLGRGGPTDVTVLATVDGDGGNGSTVVGEVSTDALTYAAGDSRLVYEGTAVFRGGRAGSVAVRPPTLVATPERTLVTLVSADVAGPIRGGSGVVLVRTERTDRDARLVRNVSDVTIRVRTDPTRVDAWERALEASTPDSDCETSTDTVECTYATETVAVTETDVRVTYER